MQRLSDALKMIPSVAVSSLLMTYAFDGIISMSLVNVHSPGAGRCMQRAGQVPTMIDPQTDYPNDDLSEFFICV